MPTDTFFNLSESKRERIIDAALREFADNPFDSASIANIVDEAEIPRGSFYQYFDDLMDLYRYLLTSCIAEEKMPYLQGVVDEEDDALTTIRRLYSAGIQFAKDHPRMATLGTNFLREDREFQQEAMGQMADASRQFLAGILQKGQRKGQIDPNVDIQMAAFAVDSLSNGLMEQYIEQQPDEVDNVFTDGDDYLQLVDKMFYIIRNGLANYQE